MNLTAAAALLAVSPRTLRLAIERGDISADHPFADGPWVISRDALQGEAAQALKRRLGLGTRDTQYLILNSRRACSQLHSEVGQYDFPRPAPSTHPTFVGLPIVARDKVIRERAVSRLRGAGIGAGSYYPSAICDIPGIEPHMSDRDFHRKHAELLSQRLLTLPVNPLVRRQDLERRVDILTTL